MQLRIYSLSSVTICRLKHSYVHRLQRAGLQRVSNQMQLYTCNLSFQCVCSRPSVDRSIATYTNSKDLDNKEFQIRCTKLHIRTHNLSQRVGDIDQLPGQWDAGCWHWKPYSPSRHLMIMPQFRPTCLFYQKGRKSHRTLHTIRAVLVRLLPITCPGAGSVSVAIYGSDIIGSWIFWMISGSADITISHFSSF